MCSIGVVSRVGLMSWESFPGGMVTESTIKILHKRKETGAKAKKSKKRWTLSAPPGKPHSANRSA